MTATHRAPLTCTDALLGTHSTRRGASGIAPRRAEIVLPDEAPENLDVLLSIGHAQEPQRSEGVGEGEKADQHGRDIGLSQPLSPALRTQAGPYLELTGEPPAHVSTGQFGSRGETEYKPVRPTLVVEAEAEGSVYAFTNRLRPTVHRPRPDLALADLHPRVLTAGSVAGRRARAARASLGRCYRKAER